MKLLNLVQFIYCLFLAMSELQRQIAEHRARHVYSSTSSVGSGLQASLFLSLKDAAAVDVSIVHQAAVKAAAQLLQYEPRFAPHIDSGVLHESSIDYQRQLKTQQVRDHRIYHKVDKFRLHFVLFWFCRKIGCWIGNCHHF